MKLQPSAVAIVIARDAAGQLVTLVGTRHPRSRFLGGYVAFPGGAHEAQDGDLARDEDAVLRRTAARELREETGIEVSAESFLDAGHRATPPFTARGFDSLMLLASLNETPAPRASDPPELLDLGWMRPEDLLRRWRALEIRIAPPVLPIIAELARAATEGAAPADIAARLRRVNDDMEADGPRIEFVPDVLMIPLRTATLPPATHTNCYFAGREEFVIVDPGSVDAEEIARLERHVRRRIAEGTRPHRILLTHHHGDHVGGATALAGALDVPIAAHRETLARLPTGSAPRVGLADGDVIPLSGGERITALHTPGHALGHLAFFEEVSGSLFAGDLVSGVSTILVDAAPGSLELYLASLERLRELPARNLFPGHGPPMIDPRRTIDALLAHRAEREARILEAIRGGAQTVAEIVRHAYADTPGADSTLAERQALAHLDRLQGKGAVARTRNGWSLPG